MYPEHAPRILIVDDEPEVCRVISMFLSSREYSCATACNAKKALELMAIVSFDIVVCDVIMPGMSGFQLLKEIRSKYHETAVIMVTGDEVSDSEIESLRLGAYGVLFKPFDRGELLGLVEEVLEQGRCEIPARQSQQYIFKEAQTPIV
jgi:DNA-binding NtrC family response regulator